MTDRSQVTTIYATRITGYRVRAPGLVHVGLGLDGFEDEHAETVARLVLPADVARSLAVTLGDAAERAGVKATDPEETSGQTVFNAVAGTSLFAFRQLLSLVAADPAFSERLDQFEREIIRNTRNMVTEGIPIHDEADAMRASVQMLEKLFEHARGERTNPDRPDDASD